VLVERLADEGECVRGRFGHGEVLAAELGGAEVAGGVRGQERARVAGVPRGEHE